MDAISNLSATSEVKIVFPHFVQTCLSVDRQTYCHLLEGINATWLNIKKERKARTMFKSFDELRDAMENDYGAAMKLINDSYPSETSSFETSKTARTGDTSTPAAALVAPPSGGDANTDASHHHTHEGSGNASEELQPQAGSSEPAGEQLMNKAVSILQRELEGIINHLKERYHSGRVDHSAILHDKSLRKLIFESFSSDASIAPYWTRLLYCLALPSRVLRRLYTQETRGLLEELVGGPINAESVATKITPWKDDETNEKIIGKLTVAQVFVVLVTAIIINFRTSGQTTEVFTSALSSTLKEQGTSERALEYLSKLGITASPSTVRFINEESLPSWFETNVKKKLVGMIKETVQDEHGNVWRKYVPQVIIDNYARVIWAAEQTSGKSFTTTIPTIQLIVAMHENETPLLRNAVICHPNRAAACTTLSEADVSRGQLLAINQSLSLNLQSLYMADDTCTSSEEGTLTTTRTSIKGNKFARLSHFINLPAIPAQSSSHEDTIIILKMLLDLFNIDDADLDVLFPVDPEFVLTCAAIAAVRPSFLRRICLGVPVFHTQKHCLEVIYSMPLFMLLLINPFLNCIAFKPSVHGNLQEELLALDFDYLKYPTAKDLLDHYPDLQEGGNNDQVQDDNKEGGDNLEVPDEDDDDDDERSLGVEQFDEPDWDRVNEEIEEAVAHQDIRLQETPMVLEAVLGILRRMEVNMLLSSRTNVSAKEIKKCTPPIISTANKKESEMVKKWQTNYQRTKFNLELLFTAYSYLKTNQTEELARALQSNALTCLIEYFFENLLRPSVEPFLDLNSKQDIVGVLEKLPTYLRIVLLANKPKISRTFLFLIIQLDHLQSNREDLLQFMASKASYFNEVFIELHNSVLMRTLDQYHKVSMQDIRDTSVLLQMKRDHDAQLAALLAPDHTSNERRPSEIKKQSDRFLPPNGKQFQQAKKLAEEFLLPLLRSYADLDIHPEVATNIYEHVSFLHSAHIQDKVKKTAASLKAYIKGLKKKDDAATVALASTSAVTGNLPATNQDAAHVLHELATLQAVIEEKKEEIEENFPAAGADSLSHPPLSNDSLLKYLSETSGTSITKIFSRLKTEVRQATATSDPHSLHQFAQGLQASADKASNKRERVIQLYNVFLKLSHNANPEDAIAICNQLLVQWGIQREVVTPSNANATAKQILSSQVANEQELSKPKKKTFAEIERGLPSSEASLHHLFNLPWPEDKRLNSLNS